MQSRATWRRLFLITLLATPGAARAQAPVDELEYEVPEGFVEVSRDGTASPAAQQNPTLAALVQKGLRLMAAKLADDGTVQGTFQVTLNNRPYTFDETTIDQFAKDMLDGLSKGGMEGVLKHKDTTLIAGRRSGRVAIVTAGRRMLFVAIPDGRRTALLLYAASEKDFPVLYSSFEKSALATHVAKPGERPAAPPPSAAPATETAAHPAPASDFGWIAILGLTALAVVGAVVFLRRKQRPAPAPQRRPRRR